MPALPEMEQLPFPGGIARQDRVLLSARRRGGLCTGPRDNALADGLLRIRELTLSKPG